MSQRLHERDRRLLAAEAGLQPPPWGGRLSVALVYPNTYRQGMSNLGLQTVYALLNRREDSRCERFFLPDPADLAEHRRTGQPLLSLETRRPANDFDLIAFSLSFENDYLNLPPLFELLQLPLFRTDRDARFPLLLAGGVCAFLNPEPLAEIIDLFAVGEAEPILPGLIATLATSQNTARDQLLARLAGQPGVYVPKMYQVDYDDAGLPAYRAVGGAPPRVARQWCRDLDAEGTASCIVTPHTEFADMRLVEVSRGCPRACRFCAAGFIYRPFRQRSLSGLADGSGLAGDSGRVGLVAAAVADYRELAVLGRTIQAAGAEVSVSSVRIDALDAEQVAMLAASGHKTLALAPEAGSQRMRDLMNKGVDEAQILAAVERIANGGIPNLKLYFMIGLPGETLADVEAIVELTGKIRDVWLAAGRRAGFLGQIGLSVNPFVPKPWTPLQWAPMVPRAELEKKYRILQKQLRTLANVTLQTESLRSAELQGLFARGDRRTAALLPLLAAGKSLKAACRDAGLDPAFYLYRERGAAETFPWEIIDQSIRRDYLWQEYQAALAARLGQVCHAGCRRCGLVC
ncbi:MAG: radical SAM protein [Desulfuromonadales bacterium]|nr:radical SAM protein [Desulfuromonadales bacterium]